MESGRQQAFIKLKPPCVELSSVALKFRTHQVPVKDVLHALEAVHTVLFDLGNQGQLDPKLAEYAFFPLAQQVFNEAQRLSPRCLEVAAKCVTILILQGYGQSLAPEMGKQLLILMTMISGAGNQNHMQPPTDELKVAAFDCINAILKTLASSPSGLGVFDDQGTKNVIDQLTYLLLDGITESPSDTVQIAASHALKEVIDAVSSRVFLASLLPRTVSSLTKALRPSTKSRRTRKVLVADLVSLRCIISKVLADDVALKPQSDAEIEATGPSWLKATASQIKTALLQVVKLRAHDGKEVRLALQRLCLMVIETCSNSLEESIPAMLETLLILSEGQTGDEAFQSLKFLSLFRPETINMLRESFFNWCQSLPRIVAGHDDKPKQRMLARLTAALKVLSTETQSVSDIAESLSSSLIDSLVGALQLPRYNTLELGVGEPASFLTLTTSRGPEMQDFGDVILNHQSHKDLNLGLVRLLDTVSTCPANNLILQSLINTTANASGNEQLSSLWLAIQLLKRATAPGTNIEEFLDVESSHADTSSLLLDDLYGVSFPFIVSTSNQRPEKENDWRLIALSMEVLAMHAERYPGDAYRPELVDSLYPALSFLGSSNSVMRSHAMTTLDRLARSCQYSSTADMLIENADYLVNSVAWKLNTYSLSTEAPQILRMMVQLCGARLIPYLDDLIQSIFAALDNYHGYPEWVELLFDTLKAIVDEGIKSPQLTITEGKQMPSHGKTTPHVSTVEDITKDLKARKKRKLDFDRDALEPPTKAPHRAWTSELDGPTFPEHVENGDDETADDHESNHIASKPSEEQDKLPKSHQLLLSIAIATVPHFASPSPRVRRLLLDLVTDISPLLGSDENTFLPFINSVWPAIIPKLLRGESASNEDSEASYNTCAAADTVTVLCQNAGDFMSSRIEAIFPELARLFRNVYKEVVSSRKPESNKTSNMREQQKGESIKGSVSLQMNKSSTSTSDALTPYTQQQSNIPQSRTSSGQILNSLINLLVTILSFVRISLDHGDEILHLLEPFLAQPGRESIRNAAETYNADAVWLLDLQLQGTTPPEMPVLKSSLQEQGLELAKANT